jgi:UDP-N-acetylglucosamine--N-acetylmuramyl-(pentapeptide) pyrophosphoryl-undecaprenol N-acetylglucosamine transferase
MAEPIYLVATPGGHLDLLIALREAWEGRPHVWVVSAGNTADSLAAQGEQVYLLPRFHGFSAKNLRLAMSGVRLGLKHRPGLVVTSGSGSVVPYCLTARAAGAKLLFVETMARVTDASDAGRVLSRVAASVLVQWPEMGSVYPHAHVCRPALLDEVDVAGNPDRDGDGTFVAVGTHIDPFDRLLEMVDDAVAAGVLPPPVAAQTGVSTYRPRAYEGTEWMTPEDVDAGISKAKYVVCHAGSGLIARALNSGVIPIVVPRRAHRKEHVDDHQLQVAGKLAEAGLVVRVESEITPRDVARANDLRPDSSVLGRFPRMAEVMRTEIDRLVGPA